MPSRETKQPTASPRLDPAKYDDRGDAQSDAASDLSRLTLSDIGLTRTPPPGMEGNTESLGGSSAGDAVKKDIPMEEPQVRSGHVSNLTDEEERKLYELWALVIELLARPSHLTDFKEGDKRKHRELAGILSTNTSSLSLHSIASDSEGRAQSILGHPLSAEFWAQLATDDPDVLLLRFLRARKWSVPDAFGMLVDALKWRRDFGVRALLRRGESAVLPHLWHSGKGYFWGHDRQDRLIVVLPARHHDRTKQSIEENMRHTVFLMEIGRRMMLPGSETVTLLFDLKDAPLASFDPASMQFMIQCFQAYYPESLGRCYVLNAPWIFWGFWRMIKPWLDPVVVAKVIFVEDPKQLTEFIDERLLQQEFGGQSAYQYRYHPPEEDSSSPSSSESSSPSECNVPKEVGQLQTAFIDSSLHLHALLNNPEVYRQASLDVDGLVRGWREERRESIRALTDILREREERALPPHMWRRVGIALPGFNDWEGYVAKYNHA